MSNRLRVTGCLLAVVLFSSCGERSEYPPYDNTAESEAFFERYNRETRERLEARLRTVTEELEGDLADSVRKEKEEQLEVLGRRMERPDYFEFLTEEDLPAGLEWEDGMDQPDIGSPEAKKGGTMHTYFPDLSFPSTIRPAGKESNGAFRAFHWDDNEMGLVKLHPDTAEIIPALADRWAIAGDRQTVYFHIDDEARWSDGTEVTSEDWITTFRIYLSDYLSVAFYRNYYSEQYWGISTYGPDYLCIRLAFPKPFAPIFAGEIFPLQTEFHREFGPDYEARYNWRSRPVTGAYVIHPEDIVKGRSITQTRVREWWARDRKYYRYRFNPDRIEFRLYRDPEKVFQLFLKGEIDVMGLNLPKRWYQDTEVEDVFSGYIERATFYNEYPRPSIGLYFNLSRAPLDNLDVRIGLSHATDWEKVIEIDWRGDAERLNLIAAGYGDFSNPNVRAREYSIEKAREAFARAGYDRQGKDGILMNAEGERLSFPLNYSKAPITDTMMQRIAEGAKKAGVEFKLEGLDGTSDFQKIIRKQHVIAFAGWGASLPIPDYYQQFHSKEAFEPGTTKPRPMTNNISVFGDPEVDPILELNRNAPSREVVRETSWKLEEIIHDRALWIPAYMRPKYRVGYWRWVRWPEGFNVMASDTYDMAHVEWIDEEMKEETLRARREGRKFEEVNRVFDQFRGGAEPDDSEPREEAPVENALEPEQPAPDFTGETEPEDER